jgi:hypothetical protein
VRWAAIPIVQSHCRIPVWPRRVITNSGAADGTIHTVHDRNGNIIAESDATGATLREYIWLPDAGYAGVDLPLAVVDGVNTPTPALYITCTPTICRGRSA